MMRYLGILESIPEIQVLSAVRLILNIQDLGLQGPYIMACTHMPRVPSGQE